MNCSRKNSGRGVAKTFITVDIQPSTASCVKYVRRKGRELLGHRKGVAEADVKGKVQSPITVNPSEAEPSAGGLFK